MKNYILLNSRSGAAYHLLLKFYSHCLANNLEFGGLLFESNKDESNRMSSSKKNNKEILKWKNDICKILGLPNALDLDDKKTNRKNIKIINFNDNGFDEKYFNDNFLNKLHNSCKIYRNINKNNLVVGIHIRRGDVSPGFIKGANRYLYNKYYVNIINLIRKFNKNAVINIYSEKKSYESFNEFRSMKCNLYLETDIHKVWTELINSHIFVMSKSSFSYVPAIYNKNIVIYHPFWHKKLKNWLDFSDPNFENILKNSINNLKK